MSKNKTGKRGLKIGKISSSHKGICVHTPSGKKIFIVDVDGRLGCSFHWFDDESEDWNYSKNCDELCGM